MSINAIVKSFGRSSLYIVLLLLAFKAKAQTPTAAFSMDVQTGCAPLAVNFTNASSGANSFSWTFGNTNTSSIANPSTVYLSPGTYNVTLTATNTISGQSASTSQTVTVVNNPIAAFTANMTSDCEDINNICFTNTSQYAATYTWDFGDGNTSNLTNPCHTYTNSGTYTVKLIAQSSYGCSDIKTRSSYITINPKPAVNFTSNIQSSCNLSEIFNFTSNTPGAVSWNWDFGDFTTSTQQNPSHTYSASGTYSVTLIATNNFGCTDTTTHVNYINLGSTLVPSFTASDSGGCAPFNVVFNCNVANATSWSWDFGDGNGSTQQNPANTYTAPGNYNITLTVTTQSGCNGTATYNNLIVVDNLPVPSFSVVQDTGCAPYSAQFVNTSTGAATYNWNFGPGTTSSTQANPTYIYTNPWTYSVTLTAYSPNGCSATTSHNNMVTVYDPNAAFSGSPLTGCPGVSVSFNTTAPQTGIVSWHWNFGDGTTSNLPNPTHIYSTAGIFNVWLAVTNSFGCKDTVYKPAYVRVYNSPIPYVVPDTIKVCQNVSQSFSDPTLGSNAWTWDFGDGSGSIVQNPSHIYPTPGVYTVTLQTAMAGGCSQTFNPYAIVEVVPYSPQPIIVNYINRCKPYTVGFSTTTPNVNVYAWNFGDGTTSALAAPTHVYAVAGVYTVTLRVTVGSGCIDVMTATVTVGHANPIQFSGYNNCKGTPVQFIVLNQSEFTSWTWRFGDGTSSTLGTVNHNYAAAGSYNISLRTVDIYGCIDTFTLAQPVVVQDPKANFTVAGNTTACLSLPVQFNNTSTGASGYLWDFGDGTTDTTISPTHIYQAAGVYTVSLTATINNCSNTKTQANLIVIISPQCNFMFTTSTLCLPITVTYTDLSPSAVSWLWDFGDGTTSTQQNPVHTFNAAPSGPVSLTITDQYGCTQTRTKTNINYYSASATSNVTSGCNPLSVSFTDLSNLATSWNWTFGDGGTSTAQNPTHVYTVDGVFDVRLIAGFPGGCIDTVFYPSMITVNTPVADFIAPAASGCSPVNISFSNMSSDATDYLWDFGDGSTSTNVNPTHIYNVPGYYDIMLIATNSTGCSDTMFRPSYIAIPGVFSNFSISSTMGCETLGVQFTDSSINAIDWNWDFGDGATSMLTDPQHTYLDTGAYTVTLITHDTLGCTSVYTYPVPVQIYPNPSALGTTSDLEGCESYTSAFTDLSTNASYVTWHFGNGDTTTNANPMYTYTTAGIYNAYVVATTSAGCNDTSFMPAITVHPVPHVSFTPSAPQVCDPDSVTFINTSNNLQNPSYTWNYGNGLTGNNSTGGVMYTDSGTYNVTLYIVNTFGCNDSVTSQIIVNPTPAAIAFTNDTTGCSPYLSSFVNSSQFADSYSWAFGDGNTSTAIQPSNTYLSGGIYTPVLIASNQYGCHDTLTLAPINVLQTPSAAFTVNSTGICPGTTAQFTSLSQDTINASYIWNFGFTSSGAVNPSITYVNPGSYDVSLLVTNANGCADSVNNLSYITVYDTVPPPVSNLLYVTVLSDTSTEIMWQNNSATDLGSYNLYRYDPSTLSYQLVYTDNNPQSINAAPTTTYQDGGLNTKSNTYTYIIQAEDHCGYRLPLTVMNAHTTMDVNAVQAGTNINVSWNAYGGCPVLWYEVDRTDVATGQTQQLALVSSSTLNFVDSTLMCPFDYCYRIKAIDLCGTSYYSYSDTSVAAPQNILAGQHVDVVKSTVINNKEVLTEWLPPTLLPQRVQNYQVLRSPDGITYYPIAIVPAQVTSYIDFSVDVQEQSYFYKVVVINDCNLYGPEGLEGTNIMLQGDWRNYHTKLNWTKYLQWDQGVDHYVIQKQNSFGVWDDYTQTNGNTTTIDIDE